jgi:two-component system chemotaxis response regulator CheY
MPDHCTLSPLILLVGHCGPDGHMLRNITQRAVPAARIEMVDDDHLLSAHLPQADLLLVNRLLDGAMSHSSGIELIRALAAKPAAPAMMLVSNYPEAQAAAEAAGALPGFGKRDAYAEETARRISDAVDRAGGARHAAS